MKLEKINQIFSKMEWLDEAIKRNEESDGRNKRSDFYYENLRIIREKQEKGIIPFEEYKKVGRQQSIEYGYYMANIHYELFKYDEKNKDELEDRIIFFLLNARDELFAFEDSWFRLNFYLDYSCYLREIYHSDDNWRDLEWYATENKNGREKIIFDILWKKYLKDEYIKEKIYLDCCSKEINEFFYDAELIDIDDFDDNQDFISYCKTVIFDRVNVIKKYSVFDFTEIKTYSLIDVNKIKGIIIYCGKYDYDLQDVIAYNLEDICKCTDWERRYGIRLIVD